MPTDLPVPGGGPVLDGPAAQAALLSEALLAADAFLVSQALRDIAQAQGQGYSFGDDPALSIARGPAGHELGACRTADRAVTGPRPAAALPLSLVLAIGDRGDRPWSACEPVSASQPMSTRKYHACCLVVAAQAALRTNWQFEQLG